MASLSGMHTSASLSSHLSNAIGAHNASELFNLIRSAAYSCPALDQDADQLQNQIHTCNDHIGHAVRLFEELSAKCGAMQDELAQLQAWKHRCIDELSSAGVFVFHRERKTVA